MRYSYKTHGTCSRQIDFDIDDKHTISNLSFAGGCNGNLQGVSRLCEGRRAEDVIESLDGINCGMKGTSCPDQLAQALKSALKEI